MDEWHEQAAEGEAHAEEHEVVQVKVMAQAQPHAQEGLLVHHHHHEEAVHTLDGPHPHPVQKSVKDLHQRASEIERFEAKSSQLQAWLTEVSGWPVGAMAQGHGEQKEAVPDLELAPVGRRILRQKSIEAHAGHAQRSAGVGWG